MKGIGMGIAIGTTVGAAIGAAFCTACYGDFCSDSMKRNTNRVMKNTKKHFRRKMRKMGIM